LGARQLRFLLGGYCLDAGLDAAYTATGTATTTATVPGQLRLRGVSSYSIQRFRSISDVRDGDDKRSFPGLRSHPVSSV
jgi:hypothetical protein